MESVGSAYEGYCNGQILIDRPQNISGTLVLNQAGVGAFAHGHTWFLMMETNFREASSIKPHRTVIIPFDHGNAGLLGFESPSLPYLRSQFTVASRPSSARRCSSSIWSCRLNSRQKVFFARPMHNGLAKPQNTLAPLTIPELTARTGLQAKCSRKKYIAAPRWDRSSDHTEPCPDCAILRIRRARCRARTSCRYSTAQSRTGYLLLFEPL